MLQRSPTYVVSRPAEDAHRELAAPPSARDARLRHHALEERAAAACSSSTCAGASPDARKKLILGGVRAYLGPDYDVDTHFTPRYNPWDQRMCLVPDADLFTAIRSRKASVVTDQIETFTETGLKLQSGAELDADLIVTATGLNLEVLSGVRDHGRRQRRRSGQDLHLQGHDVQRRAEPRLLVRLHQRVVDAEVRPDLRVRLPPAQPHEEARLRAMHAAPQRPVDHRGTLARFLLGLRPALDAPRSRSRARRRRGSCTRTTRATS